MDGKRISASPRPCSVRRVVAKKRPRGGGIDGFVNSVRKLQRREICSKRDRSFSMSGAQERFRNIRLQRFKHERMIKHSDPQTIDRGSEELKQFHMIFERVISSHPSFVRDAIHILRDILDHEEPERIERPRDRQPQRNRSAFEYIHGRGGSRGRSGRSSSFGCSSGRSRSSSSVNMPGTGKVDFDQFPYKDRIPNFIGEYLEGWNDVIADGNCGFRVVAEVFHMGENNYTLVREMIYNEIAANREIYRHVYGEDLDRSLQRIQWGGGACGSDHWFDTPLDLFAVANIYKCAVMHFGVGLHNRAYIPCCTVLPWNSYATITRPRREFAIAYLGSSYSHFIRLDLSFGFPVPPILHTWYTIRKPNVLGWDVLYHERMRHWNNLVSF